MNFIPACCVACIPESTGHSSWPTLERGPMTLARVLMLMMTSACRQDSIFGPSAAVNTFNMHCMLLHSPAGALGAMAKSMCTTPPAGMCDQQPACIMPAYILASSTSTIQHTDKALQSVGDSSKLPATPSFMGSLFAGAASFACDRCKRRRVA
jgi:hypothetical protein